MNTAKAVLGFLSSKPLYVSTPAIAVKAMHNNSSRKETVGELVPWMVESSLPEISKWIGGILKEDISYYPVELRRLTPEEALLAVYRHLDDIAFQHRLKEALTLVADSVSWKHEDPRYLSNLLASMGYLNARPGYDLLIRLGLKRTLVDRQLKPGVSLHRYLLASLAGMGCDSRSVHLFVRDINMPEYAGTCFRAIWPYDPVIAVEVSDIIVKIGAGDYHFPTLLLLKEMVSNLGLDLAWRLVDRVLTSERLNDEDKSYFATYVRQGELGFGLKPRGDVFELIRPDTIAECLPIPYREVNHDIQQHFLQSWVLQFTETRQKESRRQSIWDISPVFNNPPVLESRQHVQA
jgi:hypothetical protein